MYIASHEWQRPASPPRAGHLNPPPGALCEPLYRRLAAGTPDAATRAEAAQFLRREIALAGTAPCTLPESPENLVGWMEANAQTVHAKYALYLEGRRAGGPRHFFRNRAHALHVLRAISPTKVVDGAWLYGLIRHANNPRFAPLVQTYVEELGEGAIDKNHVVLYRGLLARYGLDPVDGLPDTHYRQGLIQLALGWNAEEFLPEVIGFNLGYEQLPLHLLITAYELNELGIDPYYFQLHVTVDNGSTGHARRACDAVLEALPRLDDGGVFWQRVRVGARLADAGLGTVDIIDSFEPEQEVLRILAAKSSAGAGAHSDYCRVAGRSVNDWLSSPENVAGFLRELEAQGWIRRNEPASCSRFWKLLQGERAEMFGVFSAYELQVIHDWIRGEASADGAPFTEEPPSAGRRRATFRALQRNAHAVAAPDLGSLLDPDLDLFKAQLARAEAGPREQLLVDAMSPAQHWTPVGLYATGEFWKSRTQ
ncbi:iron-containing redox enzyme family protein [Caenimonas sedimenti]|uniref:Iron-containing redox enzyme family protein n=1 Tax=Caenimonas sedimenti TaxID=2596921 RepID=A0A562ZWY5_9BURK|nr:iron-containing redox enzyme family protein [Caenimonas sedimenti]TWO72901.1 iron-containing redox enzyme family protein [Caenimonas sedimenti]